MSGADRAPLPPGSIVITGLGAVTPFGWGVAPLWEGARSGRCAVGALDRFDPAGHRTRIAAQVPLDAAPAPRSRRATLADRFAVAAAGEAVASAGLDASALAHAGVAFGSSTGGLIESESYFEDLLRRGPRRARPGLLASQQFDGPGDAVARALGCTGPVLTVTAACVSGAAAIEAAARILLRGEADTVVAGASDALCRVTYSGFNSLRAVDEKPSRPFRKDRAGLTLGEGAGVLVLESARHARERGARVLAVLAGAASTCDAHHMTAPHAAGAGAAVAVTRALTEAACDPADVDFINAHGTGTPHNDAAEAAAIARVFGGLARSIPVTSTKALIGHLLGSAGAVEAVVTVLCLARGEVHPMPDDGERDLSIALDLVLGLPRRLPRARVALSTSLAFGGANAALVLRRPESAHVR
ncbi:MAG TPA: beta-ketoacyl-[acyl-carrier-protein] synthase family protein [Candidatus Sulfotelmatobacter sp.]|jgi:3-oxoacyl-[acyl-carrier-protein] synthase II|nr:beta-ketoacyl-[acyl-carrier-protein] synthase family protein [Candidatus Sulfotelmatobacter sp.]